MRQRSVTQAPSRPAHPTSSSTLYPRDTIDGSYGEIHDAALAGAFVHLSRWFTAVLPTISKGSGLQQSRDGAGGTVRESREARELVSGESCVRLPLSLSFTMHAFAQNKQELGLAI